MFCFKEYLDNGSLNLKSSTCNKNKLCDILVEFFKNYPWQPTEKRLSEAIFNIRKEVSIFIMNTTDKNIDIVNDTAFR